jgi:hypothetical protein
MSPLTRSHFTSWACFDYQIGRPTDTLAGCLIDANDWVPMNPHRLDALEKMQRSRMGIYEHHGFQGNHIQLRELITARQLVCHNSSGYRGHVGELWYVRALPPLVPELATYHVIFTTPYVLIDQSKDDWIAYLKRSLVGLKAPSEAEALYRLLKFASGRTTGTSSSSWPTITIKQTPSSCRASPISKPHCPMSERRRPD